MMCKECKSKLELIDKLITEDVTNGRKLQKKLRKKLIELGADISQIEKDQKL